LKEVQKRRLGILAGKGELPWLAVRSAQQAGEDVRVFTFTDEPPPTEFVNITQPVILTKVFTSVMRSMKKENVDRLILLGKATRSILYDNPRFDLRSLFLVARMASQSDYSLFDYVSREFEKSGIKIIEQTTYLSHLFLGKGRYGKKCTTKELQDVVFGMIHAREINRLDIGQALVVGNKSVLAVECAEGTDNCIKRGGHLFHKKGASVCKVAKINHDLRFDVPVTGVSTLESMKEAGCRVLAIEASCTFVLHHSEFVRTAKKYGITILALDPEKADLAALKKLNSKEIKI